MRILSIPASSATVERVFSIAALKDGAKKRRINLLDINFEAEALIALNDSFISQDDIDF